MKIPLCLILILFFLSCQENHDDKRDVANAAKINLKSIRKIPGKSNIRSIEYIPLETNDKTLVQNIDELIFHGNKFYLLDLNSNIIFIFNRDGTFHDKIAKEGRGPGEYSDIMDFDVCKDDNSIWVYDNQSSKMIVYNESLTDFEEINLKKRFEEFSIKGQDTIYVRNLYWDGEIQERLVELDVRKMEYNSLFNKTAYEDDFDLHRFGRSMLYKSEGKLLLNPRFKNGIVQIQNGKLEKLYEIIDDFPDESMIEKYRRTPMDVYDSKQYLLGISNIYETSNTMTFKVTKDPFTLGVVIFSKSTGEYFAIDFNNEDKYFGGGSRIYGTAENKYVSAVLPASYRNEVWEFYKKRIEDSPLEEENKKILLNAEPSDNPILVIFDVKDF